MGPKKTAGKVCCRGCCCDCGGAMDDKDIQLAKVVELFTKFAKDGWRLSLLPWWVGSWLDHQVTAETESHPIFSSIRTVFFFFFFPMDFPRFFHKPSSHWASPLVSWRFSKPHRFPGMVPTASRQSLSSWGPKRCPPL